MKHIEMTYEEWAAVEDNPIQRDTVGRANYALKNHLSEPKETQASVAAASLNGKLYKLDGHTRSYLWQIGKLEKVNQMLSVTIYEANSIEDVKNLYKTFDNAKAVESAGDKISGAYRSCGIETKSELMSKGAITTAFSAIYSYDGVRKIDIYKIAPLWKKEIELLDSLNANYKQITAPILAAALVTAKIYGRESLEFWYKYANNLGVKDGGTKDAVQALTDTMIQQKLAGKTSGRDNVCAIFKKAIGAFESYRNSKQYIIGVKSIDPHKYLAKNKFFERADVSY